MTEYGMDKMKWKKKQTKINEKTITRGLVSDDAGRNDSLMNNRGEKIDEKYNCINT
jgi:hypothetical protein